MADDWFAQNKPAAQGDWFEQNKPVTEPSAIGRGARAFGENIVNPEAFRTEPNIDKANLEAFKSVGRTLSPGMGQYGHGDLLGLVHALPFLGPSLAQIGENIRSQQWPEAIGHTGGLATSTLLSSLGLAPGMEGGISPVEAIQQGKPWPVMSGAAKGAWKAGIEPIPTGKLQLPIPAVMAGGAAGAAAGYPFHMGQLGAILGAGVPVVRGAIKGGQEGLAKFRAANPVERATPPVWEGMPAPSLPPPPEFSSIPQSSLPSSRPVGSALHGAEVAAAEQAAQQSGIAANLSKRQSVMGRARATGELLNPPVLPAESTGAPLPAAPASGRMPGPITLTPESRTPLWHDIPQPQSLEPPPFTSIPQTKAIGTGRSPGGIASDTASTAKQLGREFEQQTQFPKTAEGFKQWMESRKSLPPPPKSTGTGNVVAPEGASARYTELGEQFGSKYAGWTHAKDTTIAKYLNSKGITKAKFRAATDAQRKVWAKEADPKYGKRGVNPERIDDIANLLERDD